MIIFRADGNGLIGSGHIMRCLSIAVALRQLGEESLFLLGDSTMQHIVKERGFQVQILESHYDNMESESNTIKQYLTRGNLVVVDSYYVTKLYLDSLMKSAIIVYIDDLMKVPTNVDFIINYNCYADQKLYKTVPKAKNSYLLGTTYVPLREEFQNIPYVVRKKCTKILITTGGTDEFNISGQILEKICAVKELKEMEFLVVVGAMNKHLEMLKSLAKKYNQIRICTNVVCMSELMRESDIAISAAGSTLYELCAVGVPTVSFSFVDNQDQAITCMESMGNLLSAGRYQVEGSIVIKRIVDKVSQLIKTYDLRCKIHNRCKRLVDGKGANRIAMKLMEWSEADKRNV